MAESSDWITPSGVGQFSYCEKAWDLQRMGKTVVVTKQMKRGTRKHRQKNLAVGASSILFLMAGIAALLLLAGKMW